MTKLNLKDIRARVEAAGKIGLDGMLATYASQRDVPPLLECVEELSKYLKTLCCCCKVHQECGNCFLLKKWGLGMSFKPDLSIESYCEKHKWHVVIPNLQCPDCPKSNFEDEFFGKGPNYPGQILKLQQILRERDEVIEMLRDTLNSVYLECSCSYDDISKCDVHRANRVLARLEEAKKRWNK